MVAMIVKITIRTSRDTALEHQCAFLIVLHSNNSWFYPHGRALSTESTELKPHHSLYTSISIRPYSMPSRHSTQSMKAQSQLDTFGCGAQFSQRDSEYPRSKDIDRDLSSGHQELDQPVSLAQASSSNDIPFRDRSKQEKLNYMPVGPGVSKNNSIKDN